MIKNFEQETAPLTGIELQIAALIRRGLENKVGKEKAISNRVICDRMQKWCDEQQLNYKMSDVRLRKMINHIRRNDLPDLCANNAGYYRAKDYTELYEYAVSLKQRISAQQEVYDCVMKHIVNKYKVGKLDL